MALIASNIVLTPEKRWIWFNDAIADDRAGKHVQSLRHMFSAVNNLLDAGKFAEVDEWLSSIAPGSLSDNLIVGILSITRSASDRLAFRQGFFEVAWKIVQDRGRNAEKLIRHVGTGGSIGDKYLAERAEV